MIYSNYHTHTTFCDGKDTPEQLIERALELGCPEIGFSGHSYTPFDESWCMSREETQAYRECITRLKEKYRGRIKILLGIEQDLLGGALPDREEFDYVIGSVHYWVRGEERFDVDGALPQVQATVDRIFGGDWIAAAEEYYENVAKIAVLAPSVIGHFDLITKHNEGYCLFDETDPRYVAAAKKCIDALLPLGIPFEINTGAISRGYRKSPYPAPHLREYIRERGGTFTINGDTHHKDNLCFAFEEWLPKLEVEPLVFVP